ncbi:hypothetical protein LXA43DRAFT_1091263 [Ganoderma leucocontextum]|nr:hypothetical protein LXA43DRAFT_1091263 [Ganoderma leucocontextum]
MSVRGRSLSPRPLRDEDVDMDGSPPANSHAKVVIVTNLSRNVMEAHLQAIFGFYGEIVKVDLPVYGKSGQNRGKAALEFLDSASAHKAVSHMDGGQLDGAIIKAELSELPVRSLPFPFAFPLTLPAASWCGAPWRLRSALQRRLPPPTARPQTPSSIPPHLPFAYTVPLSPAPYRRSSSAEAKVPKLRTWRHRLPWSLQELLCWIQPLAHALPHTPVSLALSFVLLFFCLLP